MRIYRYVLPVLLLAPLTLRAQEQTDRDSFTWSGRIPSGHWIRVQNLNGPITVTQSSGDKVEVRATKHWRRGNPADVRIEATKFGPGDENVIVCALWGDTARCDEHGYHADHGDRRTRNNDVSVSFVVAVPKGVKVGVGTVNGGVRVDGMTEEVEASSVNGEVDVNTTGGPVNATSVNGSVRARVGKVTSNDDMNFTTVNGSVIAEFAGDVNADVELSTVNGSLRTDYEIVVSGRLDPKHLRAHIGKPGGPRITLTTVNGGVELRRR